MSINITNNTAALRAGENLARNQRHLQKSLERLSSGRKITSPVDDPGSLAVSMKLEAAIGRLAGAQNNVQNALSFLEVQDGLLDTAGQIVTRMSELKGLASQDPMKGSQDIASYNNEFKDLQIQLYNISQMNFNGVSLFANHTRRKSEFNTAATQSAPSGEALFNGRDQEAYLDNTLSIYTSTLGATGAKVSIHKSLLLSSLTIKMDGELAGSDTTNGLWSTVSNRQVVVQDGTSAITGVYGGNPLSPSNDDAWVTLATPSLAGAITLDLVSSGVLDVALENVSYLRAQNGGGQSRLSFNELSLSQQVTNMSAALGRIIDTDIAVESTNLAKYNILSQVSASMLVQANSSGNIALMLIQ